MPLAARPVISGGPAGCVWATCTGIAVRVSAPAGAPADSCAFCCAAAASQGSEASLSCATGFRWWPGGGANTAPSATHATRRGGVHRDRLPRTRGGGGGLLLEIGPVLGPIEGEHHRPAHRLSRRD